MKVDGVNLTNEGFGFVVREDNNRPIVLFAFDNETAAEAARKHMIEVLKTSRHVQIFSI